MTVSNFNLTKIAEAFIMERSQKKGTKSVTAVVDRYKWCTFVTKECILVPHRYILVSKVYILQPEWYILEEF